MGGSVTQGEDSLTGALREVKEEVGIDLDPAQGRMIASTLRDDNFRDIWLFRYDGEIDLRNATTDEVADMRWMTTEEIRRMFATGEFVHVLDYFFDDPNLGGET